MRYPSNFSSCSHSLPLGGSFASVASCGGMNSGMAALRAPWRFFSCFMERCTMYARSENLRVYHIIPRGQQFTSCGLRISRLVVTGRQHERVRFGPEKPADLPLCKHCERIERKDSKKQ